MIKTLPIFLPDNGLAYIMAGPTRELPDDHLLVRCAAEIPVAPDRVAFDISTDDFCPFDEDVLLETVPDIMEWLADDTRKPLYVGCMGGTGRTGTILAILAAQYPGLTGEEAIKYIRAVYKPHAVETPEQREQVSRMAHITPIREEHPMIAEHFDMNEPGLGLQWDDEPGGPEQPMEPRSRGWFASLWHRLIGG